jgi:hypothetical protein
MGVFFAGAGFAIQPLVEGRTFPEIVHDFFKEWQKPAAERSFPEELSSGASEAIRSLLEGNDVSDVAIEVLSKSSADKKVMDQLRALLANPPKEGDFGNEEQVTIEPEARTIILKLTSGTRLSTLAGELFDGSYSEQIHLDGVDAASISRIAQAAIVRLAQNQEPTTVALFMLNSMGRLRESQRGRLEAIIDKPTS